MSAKNKGMKIFGMQKNGCGNTDEKMSNTERREVVFNIYKKIKILCILKNMKWLKLF